jgi:hypothetical protein
MSPATAARSLAAGLVLFAALSAHADEAAPARAAVGTPMSPAPVAAAFAPVFEEPAGSPAIAADDEWLARRDARSAAPSELRDVPRFESDAVTRTAASGLPERGRDPSARLAVRSRRTGLLVGVSVPF